MDVESLLVSMCIRSVVCSLTCLCALVLMHVCTYVPAEVHILGHFMVMYGGRASIT